jgi:hypothetical protein
VLRVSVTNVYLFSFATDKDELIYLPRLRERHTSNYYYRHAYDMSFIEEDFIKLQTEYSPWHRNGDNMKVLFVHYLVTR